MISKFEVSKLTIVFDKIDKLLINKELLPLPPLFFKKT